MKPMRMKLLLATLLLIGAGCAPETDVAPPVDETPYVNEDNCTGSGGAVVEGYCECPEAFAPDPAGFCLDAQGRPGGPMAEE